MKKNVDNLFSYLNMKPSIKCLTEKHLNHLHISYLSYVGFLRSMINVTKFEYLKMSIYKRSVRTV